MGAVHFSRYEFVPVAQDIAETIRPGIAAIFLDVPYPTPKKTLLQDAPRVSSGAGESPWSLAWKLYNSIVDYEQDIRPTSLFDVVCNANDILDPNAPIPTNAPLLLPRLDVIQSSVRIAPPFYQANTIT